MTLRTGKRTSKAKHYTSGFTLVELILVLALLLVVAALVTPILAKFFDGRALDSEVRKFVSLTHYGRSRAVSEGTPMTLWVDAKNGSYGLQRDASFGDNDTKAMQCQLAEGLKIDVVRNRTTISTASTSATGRILNGQTGQRANKLPAINFSPDGTITTATSVAAVTIQDVTDAPVWLGPDANNLGYSVQQKNDILANNNR